MRIYPCPYLEGEIELTDEREAHITKLDYHRLSYSAISKWRSRMAQKLTFQYDREGDILYINTVAPYAEQESEELGDEVIARLNPQTRKVENIEVLFFTSRLLRKEWFSLPISADLQQVELAYASC